MPMCAYARPRKRMCACGALACAPCLALLDSCPSLAAPRPSPLPPAAPGRAAAGACRGPAQQVPPARPRDDGQHGWGATAPLPAHSLAERKHGCLPRWVWRGTLGVDWRPLAFWLPWPTPARTLHQPPFPSQRRSTPRRFCWSRCAPSWSPPTARACCGSATTGRAPAPTASTPPPAPPRPPAAARTRAPRARSRLWGCGRCTRWVAGGGCASEWIVAGC